MFNGYCPSETIAWTPLAKWCVDDSRGARCDQYELALASCGWAVLTHQPGPQTGAVISDVTLLHYRPLE